MAVETRELAKIERGSDLVIEDHGLLWHDRLGTQLW